MVVAVLSVSVMRKGSVKLPLVPLAGLHTASSLHSTSKVALARSMPLLAMTDTVTVLSSWLMAPLTPSSRKSFMMASSLRTAT